MTQAGAKGGAKGGLGDMWGLSMMGKPKRGWCRRRERCTGALESWREPWLGNKLELSRSTTARVVIWKRNAKRVRIWNTDIELGWGDGVEVEVGWGSS